MNITVLKPEEWQRYSQAAHQTVFGRILAEQADQYISHALLLTENNTPVGYVTAQLHDPETVYWKFGGAFPPGRGRHTTFAGYQAFINYEKAQGRKRIVTYVENTNRAMLRFSAHAGFKIIGVKTHAGHVLLEHCLELE